MEQQKTTFVDGIFDSRLSGSSSSILQNSSLLNRFVSTLSPKENETSGKLSFELQHNYSDSVIDWTKTSLSYDLEISGLSDDSLVNHDFLPFLNTKQFSLNFSPMTLFKSLDVKINSGSGQNIINYSTNYDLINTLYLETYFDRDTLNSYPECFYLPVSRDKHTQNGYYKKYPYLFCYKPGTTIADKQFLPVGSNATQEYNSIGIKKTSTVIPGTNDVAADIVYNVNLQPFDAAANYGGGMLLDQTHEGYRHSATVESIYNRSNLTPIVCKRYIDFLNDAEIIRRDRYLISRKQTNVSVGDQAGDFRFYTYNHTISRTIPFMFIDQFFSQRSLINNIHRFEMTLEKKNFQEYFILSNNLDIEYFSTGVITIKNPKINFHFVYLSESEKNLILNAKLNSSYFTKIAAIYYDIRTVTFSSSFSYQIPNFKRPIWSLIIFPASKLTGSNATKNNMQKYVANDVSSISVTLGSVSLINDNYLIQRNLDSQSLSRSNLYNEYKMLCETTGNNNSFGYTRRPVLSYESFLGLDRNVDTDITIVEGEDPDIAIQKSIDKYYGECTIYPINFYNNNYQELPLNPQLNMNINYYITLANSATAGIAYIVTAGINLISIDSQTGNTEMI